MSHPLRSRNFQLTMRQVCLGEWLGSPLRRFRLRGFLVLGFLGSLGRSHVPGALGHASASSLSPSLTAPPSLPAWSKASPTSGPSSRPCSAPSAGMSRLSIVRALCCQVFRLSFSSSHSRKASVSRGPTSSPSSGSSAGPSRSPCASSLSQSAFAQPSSSPSSKASSSRAAFFSSLEWGILPGSPGASASVSSQGQLP
jgi:hypothetical protein